MAISKNKVHESFKERASEGESCICYVYVVMLENLH